MYTASYNHGVKLWIQNHQGKRTNKQNILKPLLALPVSWYLWYQMGPLVTSPIA